MSELNSSDYIETDAYGCILPVSDKWNIEVLALRLVGEHIECVIHAKHKSGDDEYWYNCFDLGYTLIVDTFQFTQYQITEEEAKEIAGKIKLAEEDNDRVKSDSRS